MNLRLGSSYKFYFEKISTIIEPDGSKKSKVRTIGNIKNVSINAIAHTFKFMGEAKYPFNIDGIVKDYDVYIFCLKDNSVLNSYIFTEGTEKEKIPNEGIKSWYSLDDYNYKFAVFLLKSEVDNNLYSAISEDYDNIKTKFTSNLDGKACNYCTKFYDYAVANMPNNVLKCYSCRESNVLKRMF